LVICKDTGPGHTGLSGLSGQGQKDSEQLFVLGLLVLVLKVLKVLVLCSSKLDLMFTSTKIQLFFFLRFIAFQLDILIIDRNTKKEQT
jgi:hypothetical protein